MLGPFTPAHGSDMVPLAPGRKKLAASCLADVGDGHDCRDPYPEIYPRAFCPRRKTTKCEHHLQRAISAQQVYGEKRDNMVIPVPEAERNITHYESLYPGEFKMPKQLIHIQRE
ncbi:Enhancer of polycomb 1 [Liparis tanakae]|uniref:Enhancer of polycomb 1 n=1 Tax=Liparis tanakae TaxID=230148 RepID=A0A4Z2EW13_9TELE|nr:Enhancer of polycomb 1 [Liparis tanakae]